MQLNRRSSQKVKHLVHQIDHSTTIYPKNFEQQHQGFKGISNMFG